MIFRVVMSGRMYGQTVQNVVHMHKSDATWPTDGNALAVAIRDNWIAGTHGVKDLETTDVTWTEVKVYNADSPSLSPVALAISIQGFDSNGATQIFSFSSYVFRIRAISGGRHGRGRIYLPAPRFGNFIGGILTSAAISLINPVLAQLTAAFITSGGSTGFNVGIAPRGSPASFIGADSITVASVAGVQRRRNIGVGI